MALASAKRSSSASMSAFSFSRLVSLPMGQAYHYISKFSASELGPMMKNYSKMQVSMSGAGGGEGGGSRASTARACRACPQSVGV